MTLEHLTPEQKAEHFRQYSKQYNKMYYRRQREEQNERYEIIKQKARERYYKKKAETDPDKKTAPYRKTNIVVNLMAENANPMAENEIPLVGAPDENIQ